MHTIKITGVSDEMIASLDERVRQYQWLGRSEYIRNLIRDNLFNMDKSIKATIVNSKQNDDLICRGPDAEAEGIYFEGGIIVKKGSLTRRTFAPSTEKGSVKYRDGLVNLGVLSVAENENRYRFNQDFLFPSPSLAANVVLARQASGWKEWKTNEGKSLNDLRS